MNNAEVDHAKDIDVVVPMYNLTQHSDYIGALYYDYIMAIL